METNPVVKQTLLFCHTALTRTLDAALAVQSQSHILLERLLEQSPVMPHEGKRAISEWIEACRHQTEAVKTVIGEGFMPFHLHSEE